MKKMVLLFLFLCFCISFISAQESIIPIPQNRMLYTEYTSLKTSPYIKKKIEADGWLAMNGDSFAFFQKTPSVMKVVKNGEEIMLTIGNALPMKMKASDNGNMDNGDISMLFTAEPSELQRVFFINSEPAGEKMRYFLKPKNANGNLKNLEFLRFVSKEDKLEKLELKYKNGTLIEFKFYNAVTGVEPDETLFR